jgi:hypothetical protein
VEGLEGVARAGLGSALYALKVPTKVIAAILRHDPLTSWKYYIDAPDEESVKAMEGIEEWFIAAAETIDESHRESHQQVVSD